MDLVVLIVFLLIIVAYFKSFDSFVYFFVITDIFLRILSFVLDEYANYLSVISEFINNKLPSNIIEVINTYSTGIFNDILVLCYVCIYVVFEVYAIRLFVKKRRRRR